MSEHISSLKLYVGIWLALLAGTFLTVLAAGIDLGPLNPVVALPSPPSRRRWSCSSSCT